MTNRIPTPPEARTVIVGVDTHKYVHVAVAIDSWGIRLGDHAFVADSGGYEALVTWAETHGRIETFGIEGTGSYGAGLARAVRRAGHHVVEVNRGDRRTRRAAGKSDTIDAEVAARSLLTGQSTAIPKTADGAVEMIRQLKITRDTAMKARTTAMNTLKQIIVQAPPVLREALHDLTDHGLLTRCAGLRPGPIDTPIASAKHTLRSLARRWMALAEEIALHETHESGQTALMWAISEHHVDVVRTLLTHAADVHAQSNGGFTPLLFAAREGQVEVARRLVARGVGVNESAPDGTHPLLMAISSRQLAFAHFLLANGADPNAETGGNTALHAAVTSGLSGRRYRLAGTEPSGKLELVRELTARGADVNAQAGARRGRVTIGRSVVEGATDPYTFGVGSRRLATPFWLAADATNVALMRALLEAGADPHLSTEDGSTPLMVAAGLGHAGDARRREGWTASRAVAAVDLLLGLGADVNATNEAGFTALHGTAFPGATAVVPLLVAQAADLNAQEFRGRTAYRIAQGHKGSGMIFQEWPETAALLADLGTDITLGVDPWIAEREGGLAVGAAAGNDPVVDSRLHQIRVASAAFEHGASIPSDYTADGQNISPPLGWDELPAATRALAVVAEDPDAATLRPFVHWVLYNIPATARGLPEAIPPGVIQPEGPIAGAIQGLTGFERGGARYMGPAPPPGERHRYRFIVYALDATLNLGPGLNKETLLEAIQGHLIGSGEIVGTYARSAAVVEGARR